MKLLNRAIHCAALCSFVGAYEKFIVNYWLHHLKYFFP